MTRRNQITVIICIATIMVAFVALYIIYRQNKDVDFIYNENLQETALVIKDKEENIEQVKINLQEMAYYIINVEGDINQMACQYNSEHPEKYWNLKIETIYTMRDYAKDLAFDSCVRDNIYYMEALRNGIELTEEELELASKDAKIILKNLTGQQMDMSDYTIETLYEIEKKLYLSSKYINTLTLEGYTEEDLDIEGDYYKELLSSYIIEENDDVWSEITLGSISVNGSTTNTTQE